MFRYCGTKLDKEMACGKNSSVGRGGHMTGISGDVNCCSNREVELITKWKEVNMADLQLQRVRQLFLRNTGLYLPGGNGGLRE